MGNSCEPLVKLRLRLQIRVFAHPKLTGMASMQGVGIEILKAIFVGHVGGHVVVH